MDCFLTKIRILTCFISSSNENNSIENRSSCLINRCWNVLNEERIFLKHMSVTEEKEILVHTHCDHSDLHRMLQVTLIDSSVPVQADSIH
jgi:hypothetical protein